MNPIKKKSSNLSIAIIAVTMVCLGTQLGFSQGLNLIQSSFNRGSSEVSSTSTDNLGPSVQEVNRLATQMAWQVGWEVSRNKDASKELSSLHKELRKHSALTADLLKAYQGDSEKTFQKAASEVKKSVKKIKEMVEKSKASATVAQMVTRSEPISTFLYEHRTSFKPES